MYQTYILTVSSSFQPKIVNHGPVVSRASGFPPSMLTGRIPIKPEAQVNDLIDRFPTRMPQVTVVLVWTMMKTRKPEELVEWIPRSRKYTPVTIEPGKGVHLLVIWARRQMEKEGPPNQRRMKAFGKWVVTLLSDSEPRTGSQISTQVTMRRAEWSCESKVRCCCGQIVQRRMEIMQYNQDVNTVWKLRTAKKTIRNVL